MTNLLGVKQIAIDVNKVECDTAANKQSHYDEIASKRQNGMKKDFIVNFTAVLPISDWMGDTLLKKATNKMDCETAACKQSRYDEIANETNNMLIKGGWKKDFIDNFTQSCQSPAGWVTLS